MTPNLLDDIETWYDKFYAEVFANPGTWYWDPAVKAAWKEYSERVALFRSLFSKGKRPMCLPKDSITIYSNSSGRPIIYLRGVTKPNQALLVGCRMVIERANKTS